MNFEIFKHRNNGEIRLTKEAEEFLKGKPDFITEAVLLAGELYYGKDVISKLVEATSQYQIERILIQARNAEFTKKRPICA